MTQTLVSINNWEKKSLNIAKKKTLSSHTILYIFNVMTRNSEQQQEKHALWVKITWWKYGGKRTENQTMFWNLGGVILQMYYTSQFQLFGNSITIDWTSGL